MNHVSNNMQLVQSWLPSRHTYKKLGSIVEHLAESINSSLYEIRICYNQYPPCAIIRICPFPVQMGVQTLPVWELVWNSHFNNKVYIDAMLLAPNAEW